MNVEKATEKYGLSCKSYGYCYDCNEYFDLHGDRTIETSGHENCTWRYVTPDELPDCVANCLHRYPVCGDCGSLNISHSECEDCHSLNVIDTCCLESD